MRLRRAHLELVAGDPADPAADVAAIGARWGFAKPGSFTTAYRRAYGVAPSHTLRADKPRRPS